MVLVYDVSCGHFECFRGDIKMDRKKWVERESGKEERSVFGGSGERTERKRDRMILKIHRPVKNDGQWFISFRLLDEGEYFSANLCIYPEAPFSTDRNTRQSAK